MKCIIHNFILILIIVYVTLSYFTNFKNQLTIVN